MIAEKSIDSCKTFNSDLIKKITQNKKSACITLITTFLKDDTFGRQLLEFLDDSQIYGDKVCIFLNIICNNDFDTIKKTTQALTSNIIPKIELDNKFKKKDFSPFIIPRHKKVIFNMQKGGNIMDENQKRIPEGCTEVATMQKLLTNSDPAIMNLLSIIYEKNSCFGMELLKYLDNNRIYDSAIINFWEKCEKNISKVKEIIYNN